MHEKSVVLENLYYISYKDQMNQNDVEYSAPPVSSASLITTTKAQVTTTHDHRSIQGLQTSKTRSVAVRYLILREPTKLFSKNVFQRLMVLTEQKFHKLF